ncbi:UNVERIFIED_CONTAM: DUF1345 domain-containing protein [Salmonella enterica subsp. enterica serovar Enteritidis]
MLHRHNPFYIAAVAGLAALALALVFYPHLAYVLGANTFFIVYLILTAFKIRRLTADFLRKNAARSDEPMVIIFLVTLGTVVVAVGSLFVLINSGKHPQLINLVPALAAVPLGWATIHAMAAIHYAHLYWQPDETAEGTKDKPRKHVGGLDFPGEKEPGGIEFSVFFLCHRHDRANLRYGGHQHRNAQG